MGVVINFAGQMTGISVIVLYSKNLYQLLDFGDPDAQDETDRLHDSA